MATNGIRPFPFQYQQRGRDLAPATGETLAIFHERRDQDLENFLANLDGGGGIRTYYYVIGPEGAVDPGEVDFLATTGSGYNITAGLNEAIAQGAANPLNVAVVFLLPGQYTFDPITLPGTMALAVVCSPIAAAYCLDPVNPAVTGGSNLIIDSCVFGNVAGGLCWDTSYAFASMAVRNGGNCMGGVNGAGTVSVHIAGDFTLATGMAGNITAVGSVSFRASDCGYTGTVTGGDPGVYAALANVVFTGKLVSSAGAVECVVRDSTMTSYFTGSIIEADGNAIVKSSNTEWSNTWGVEPLITAGALLLAHCVGDTYTCYEVGIVDGTAGVPSSDAAVTFGNCSFHRPDSTSFTEPMLTLSAAASYNFLTGNAFRESATATGQVMLEIAGQENVVSGNYFRNSSATPTDINIVGGANDNAIRKNSGNDTGLLPYITDAGTGTVVD